MATIDRHWSTRGSDQRGPSLAQNTPDKLARSFRAIAERSSDRELNQAYLTLLVSLRAWVPSFVVRNLARRAADSQVGDALEIAEDAVQHIVVRASEGRTTELAQSSEALAIAWCKRVALNFVADELRLRRRRATLPRPDPIVTVDSYESSVDTEKLLKQLILALRREISSTSRPQNVSARLQLFDDFVGDVFRRSFEAKAASPSNRIHQRRRRGRRIAQLAWRNIKPVGTSDEPLVTLAVALGFDGDAPANPATDD